MSTLPREDGERVGRARRAEVRALERVHRDVHFRQTGDPGSTLADLLADEQHRRFIALPFSDHDRAVDRNRIQDLPHRLHCHLIGSMPIAVAHGVRRGNRGVLDNAQELQGQIKRHAD